MILPLVTAPYIARVIGVQGTGVYSYTYSVARYFLLVAMLGVNHYGNRQMAAIRENKEKRNKVFSSIYSLQLMTSGIVIILYVFYLIYFVDENKIIATLQICYVIAAALDINWVFFGLEEFKITVSSKFLIKIATVAAVFIFVKDVDDLWIYTLIMSTGYLIGQMYLWVFLRKHVKFVRVKFSDVISNLKPTLCLFFPVMATSVYRVMDKIMIGFFSSMVQVGLYENAEKIIMVSLGGMSALGTVMLPRMANLAANGKIEESRKYLIKSMKFAMFMACAIGFGIASVSKEFAPIFFGKEFQESSAIMLGLAPTVIFISWANVIRTQYLIPNSKDKIYLYSVCLGAIVNVALNWIFISNLGAMGAVIGTIATEAIVAIYQTIKSRKKLDVLIYLKNSGIFIFSGSVMFIAVRVVAYLMKPSILSLLVEIFIGGIIYLGILAIKFIVKDKNLINYIKKR